MRTRPAPARPARGGGISPQNDDGSAAEVKKPPPEHGSRFSPKNWRVRTKLNAILLIPVMVALVVGGFSIKGTVDRWQEADNAYRIANLERAAATYSQALTKERDVSIEPLIKGDTMNVDVADARDATDQAATAFHTAVAQTPKTPSLKRRLDLFFQAEPNLSTVRQAAYTSRMPGVQTIMAYTMIQHPLMEFANDLGLGTSTSTSFGRSLFAISLAKSGESLARAIGMEVLVEGQVPAAQRAMELKYLGSYAFMEQLALQEFTAGGSEEDAARLKQAEQQALADGKPQMDAAVAKARSSTGTSVTPPDRATMIDDIAAGKSPKSLKLKGITPEVYFTSATLTLNAYRDVEQTMAEQAAKDARTIADSAQAAITVNSATVLAGVLAAFVVAGLMARGMSRSMTELRTAAFEVAEQRLPSLVKRLSRTDPGRVDTHVAPIAISSNDEIGEVARAFDQIHSEAVRLAAEQALLRGNVNAIFSNLSMRNQGLVQRQLALITDLENHETDPDQLEDLFKLDHLATRMRRNGENLLVLAGQEQARRWTEPVPLVDVIRAATSEVEQYERIQISGIPETRIHGGAVTDLVHLLAELLENATSFSSPQTKVRVGATLLPDGRVLIEIHDRGIGLTPEQLADINHRLADPPTVDVEVSKRMGLFVVGRLADRHGIRAQLRPSDEQGSITTSLVMLPAPISQGSPSTPEPEGDFAVSRLVREHDAPDTSVHTGERTAAELGFDDHRYDGPDTARPLNPIGGPGMREEGRAAPESRTPDRQAGRHLEIQGVREDASYATDGHPAAGQPYPGQPLYPEGAGSGAYQDNGRSYEPGYQQQYDGGYAGGQQSPYRTTGAPAASAPRPEAGFGTQGWTQGYRQESSSAQIPESRASFPGSEQVGYEAPDNGDAARSEAGLRRRGGRRRVPLQGAPHQGAPQQAAPQQGQAPEDTRESFRRGTGGQGGQ